MKYAIWCAVSTPEQARDEKASLAEQEKRCREEGERRGWTEAVAPFIVAGESRTRWVNLRDAELEIPQLRNMLEAAKQGRFDLLMLYDYNRLRDLLDPVAKTLDSYGVQIFSTSQPVEPQSPEEYNPYASDSASMMMGMNQIVSRWQIADLRRKFRMGVTKRVRQGIHSIRVPFGYRVDDKSQQRPARLTEDANTVIRIKNMFLSGRTYRDIAAHLNEMGLPSPEGKLWSHTTVKKTLINPFYAGKVFFGRTRTVRDPRNNTKHLIKNPNPMLVDGQHEAIFTWEEHQAILAEVRRKEDMPRNNRYPFSGLLVCAVCDKRMLHDRDGWRCSNPHSHHTFLKDEEADALIPRVLQKALLSVDPDNPLPTLPLPVDALNNLERRRKLVQQAYESEIYTLEEAEGKIKQIDAQIQAYKDEEAQQLQRQVERKQFLSTLDEVQLLLEDLPAWTLDEDPKLVNTILLRLCKKITVTPDGQLAVYFRE